MSKQFDFDQLLDFWLADGPSELPDQAVSRIVQSIDDNERQPGDEHPGRRWALRPAHRDPQALRPRRRQARRPGPAGLAESDH